MAINSYKPVSTIIVESIFIGFVFVILFIVFLGIFNLTPLDHMYNMILSAFVASATFHVLCEYTGLNVWYVNQYYKLLPKI